MVAPGRVVGTPPAPDVLEHRLVHGRGRLLGARDLRGDAGLPQDDGAHGTEHAGPPRGFAVFAADTTIRRVIDPAGAIEHWSEHDRGGHFPAMEVPDLLTDDIRAFFREPRRAVA